jgi:hypothetical protein
MPNTSAQAASDKLRWMSGTECSVRMRLFRGQLGIDHVRPFLRTDEELVAHGEAEPSVPGVEPPAYPPVGLATLLDWVVWYVEKVRLTRQLVAATASTAYPLRQRMLLVLTSERLLCFDARRWRSRLTLPSDVPRWQIQSVTTEYLPLGPSTCTSSRARRGRPGGTPNRAPDQLGAS